MVVELYRESSPARHFRSSRSGPYCENRGHDNLFSLYCAELNVILMNLAQLTGRPVWRRPWRSDANAYDVEPKAVVSGGNSAGDATRSTSTECGPTGGRPSDRVVRASSLVENFTGAYRCEPTSSCDGSWGRMACAIAVPVFFLNHRCILRKATTLVESARVSAELLTGEPHAHWLELLGSTWSFTSSKLRTPPRQQDSADRPAPTWARSGYAVRPDVTRKRAFLNHAKKTCLLTSTPLDFKGFPAFPQGD